MLPLFVVGRVREFCCWFLFDWSPLRILQDSSLACCSCCSCFLYCLLRWPESIRANRFRVTELNPFVANRASGGLKIVNRGIEAICAIRLHIMKIGFFCESIRVNRFARIAPICVANRRAIYDCLSSCLSSCLLALVCCGARGTLRFCLTLVLLARFGVCPARRVPETSEFSSPPPRPVAGSLNSRVLEADVPLQHVPPVVAKSLK